MHIFNLIQSLRLQVEIQIFGPSSGLLLCAWAQALPFRRFSSVLHKCCFCSRQVNPRCPCTSLSLLIRWASQYLDVLNLLRLWQRRRSL